MRVRPPVPVALLGAIVALSACGGGGPDRVSKAAMVRRADRVCARGLRDADRLRGEAAPGARGKAAAAEIDASITVLERQIDAFDRLRGPASTDATRASAVRHLRAAAAGLRELRNVVERRNVTVNDAVRTSPGVVNRINAESAGANEALVRLGFLTCVGVESGG